MQKESIIMNRNNVLRKYKSLNNESKELFSTVFYIEQEILRPIANKVGLKPEDILLALNSNSTLIDLINHKRGIQPKKSLKGKKLQLPFYSSSSSYSLRCSALSLFQATFAMPL